jgi:uncharacterized membrane protein YkoI
MNMTAAVYRPLLALALVLLSFGGSARDLGQDEALRLRREGLIMPLEQMLVVALERYPGAVLLEVELEEEQGVLVYEVELVTAQGVVRELELDAQTAQLLKDELED